MNKLIITFLFLACLFLASCYHDNEPNSPVFIKNARILEEGQTLSPGTIVHLAGTGYLDSDDVILNFLWDTGNNLIPEGYTKGYHAEVLTKSSDGFTIKMPYRKPASRVEINIKRNGNMMIVGEVNLTDGITPQEFNLYGVFNATKIQTSLEKQILRWANEDNNPSDMQSWSLDEYPDFHSVIGAYRIFGICGLSKENENQYPIFFDLCTQEWNKLSDLNTIALFGNGTTIGAIQTHDGKLYEAVDITANLDRSDEYSTSRSTPIPMSFSLPEELKGDQLGDFPGAYTPNGILLAANKGNGKWIPVFFNFHKGFTTSEEIEAERIIPFAIQPNGKENPHWTFGYIVVKEHIENGNHSFLYTIDENGFLSQLPNAAILNKALSAAVNYNKPGMLTVHFDSHRDLGNGNITMEYSFAKQEWTPINVMGGCFDEIVWIN